MGLAARHTKRGIISILNKDLKGIERQILKVMFYTGESFIKEAKDNLNPAGNWEQRVLTQWEEEQGKQTPSKGNYVDWTGNLRSSIGYFVLNNGDIVSKKLEGKSEGIAAAKSLLTLVPKISGYQLVGVAGMDYASYVESKGYNVITSQSVTALVDLKKRLQKFVQKFNAKHGDPGFSADDIDFGYIATALEL
nr:hypothetical protein [uncultured Draconibacterium sp.]